MAKEKKKKNQPVSLFGNKDFSICRFSTNLVYIHLQPTQLKLYFEVKSSRNGSKCLSGCMIKNSLTQTDRSYCLTHTNTYSPFVEERAM